jgi:CNP1-like family protein
MHLRFLIGALVLVAAAAQAQVAADDPDWREVEAPPAPALKLQGLIPLEMPGSGLQFGVDPDSISIGSDGIVRYVVVATSSSGVVNGIYEGVRCDKGEVKVYARHNATGGWTVSKDPKWRAVNEQRYTNVIARGGACVGRGANQSAARIARDLRTPLERRYLVD